MKLEVKTAKTVQPAVPELNKPETTLYYVIFGTEDSIAHISIGEKNYNAVNKLLENENRNNNVPKPKIKEEQLAHNNQKR